MIYVISKSTCGSYNVRDIQCNANWDCCPYSDYALIPDNLVDGILATKGYCDITLNSAGTEVVSFKARTIPSVQEECRAEDQAATTPKTVRGSSVAMNDSGYAPLQGLKLYGKTTQDGTPTPDAPVELESVGESKNLIDPAAITTAANTNIYAWRENGITLQAGTYTMWYVPGTKINGMYVRTLTEPVTTIAVAYNVNQLTFTLAEATTLYLDFYGEPLPDNSVSSVMLEKGSAPTKYMPYQKGNIGVSVLGKNLFGGEALADKLVEVAQATKDEVAGTVTFTASNASGKVFFDCFAPNKQYTIFMYGRNSADNTLQTNLYIRYTDGTVTHLRFYAPNVYSYAVITTDAGKTVESFCGAWSQAQTILEYDKCGIFEGVLTEADFEPYKAPQTLTAQTPNGLPGIPVSSGGNYTDESGQQWICDEVDFAKGVYVHRVEELLITDATGARLHSNGRIYFEISPNAPRFKMSYEAVSNIERAMMNGSSGVYFNVVDGVFTTVDEFISYVANNPIQVILPLAEPTETPLSAEELAQYSALHTNKPNTTVFNDAGADMEIAYCTPNTAVPMNMGSGNAGRVLSVDKHGCVTTAPDVVITSLAELDTKVHSGWYGFYYGGDESCNIGGYLSGGIRVDKTREGAYQTFYPDDASRTVLTRCMIGNVWDEWEWENSPMIPGVEYRTTERWNGKPVYTKVVEFGALPNNETKTVAWTPDSGTCDYVVGYSGTTSGYGALPNHFANIFLSVNRASVFIETSDDRSSGSAVVAIKYTKV